MTSLHISAPFHAFPGYVFVLDRKLQPYCIPARDFRLLGRALGAERLKCSYCNDPAVQLDHSYPYISELTMCATHAAMPHEGWVRVGHSGYWHWFQGHRSLCWRWESEKIVFDVERPAGKVCATCARKRKARRD